MGVDRFGQPFIEKDAPSMLARTVSHLNEENATLKDRVAELEDVAKSNITGIKVFVKMLPGKGLTDEDVVIVYRAATVELLMHFKEMPDQRAEVRPDD